LSAQTHLRLERFAKFASGQLHFPVALQDRHEVVHELDVPLVTGHAYPGLFQRIAAIRVATAGALCVFGLVLHGRAIGGTKYFKVKVEECENTQGHS